jgi:hypothetical protein
MYGTSATAPAARKKQRIHKKVKEQAIVNTIKMLMLVQRRRTFNYALVCGDDDSQHFCSCWLNEGNNNIDFLAEKQGLVPLINDNRAQHFISFQESTNGLKKPK